jgi:hypothetical protein
VVLKRFPRDVRGNGPFVGAILLQMLDHRFLGVPEFYQDVSVENDHLPAVLQRFVQSFAGFVHLLNIFLVDRRK